MPRVLRHTDADLWNVVRSLSPQNPVFVTPTDTIYGFSTRHSNQRGRERIRDLKGLAHTKFITLIRNAEEFALLSRATHEQARVALRHWPGPYTFIVPAETPGESIALRMPRNPFVERLMEAMGGPLVSTSCNLHGLPPSTDILSALRQFGDGVDLYVDGGPATDAVASTLVDLTGDQPKVIRPGAGAFP